MTDTTPAAPETSDSADSSPADTAGNEQTPADPGSERPREIGGRKGPDPTRYGDWEKNGRCIDF